MATIAIYIAAAIAEIAGCFAFWAWFRLRKSMLWLMPGLASLVAFAWLLTFSSAERGPSVRRLWRHLYCLITAVALDG